MTDALPESGSLIDGRFRLGIRTDRSWTAEIFSATDERHDNAPVELELVRASGRLADYLERRHAREVALGRRFGELPHVLPAVGRGELDGGGWMYVARRALPGARPFDHEVNELEDAVWRLLDASQRLGELHAQGLIAHRDLSPRSLVLDSEGKVHVARLGLARAEGVKELSPGPAGLDYAEPRAVPPEGFTRPDELIANGDVYSLGTLLFKLIAGRWPYQGPSGQLVVAQQLAVRLGQAAVPAPTRSGGPTPMKLARLCALAMSLDLNQRPATPAALNKLCEDYLSLSSAGQAAALQAAAQVAPAPQAIEDMDTDVGVVTAEPAVVAPADMSPAGAVSDLVELEGLDLELLGHEDDLVAPDLSSDFGDVPIPSFTDPTSSERLRIPQAAAPAIPGAEPAPSDVSGLPEPDELPPPPALPTPAPEPAPEPAPAAALPPEPAPVPAPPKPIQVAPGLLASDDLDDDDDDMQITAEMLFDGPLPSLYASGEVPPLPTSSEPAPGPVPASAPAPAPVSAVSLAPPGGAPGPVDEEAPEPMDLPELDPDELQPLSAFDDFQVHEGALIVRLEGDLPELVKDLNQLEPKGLRSVLLDMRSVQQVTPRTGQFLEDFAFVARRRGLPVGMFGVTSAVRSAFSSFELMDTLPFLLNADEVRDAVWEMASLA